MSAQTLRNKLEHAMQLVSAGRAADAKAALLRLAQQHPRDPMLLSVLIANLAATGDLDAALYYANRAVEVSGGSVAALTNRARIHLLAHRTDPAIADLRAALAIKPDDHDTRASLADILESNDRSDEALALLDEVAPQVEGSIRLTETRAKVLLALGHADQALAIEKSVIPRDPVNPAVAERAHNAAIYAYHTTPAEIKELAARFGRLVSVRMPVTRPPFKNTADPDRRLRIGFIGGDFRAHASMRFFEPLALNYDKQQLEVRCYMTLPGEDATTAGIRAAVDHFQHVNALKVADLAALLRKDQLDIAVDLAGHTVGHRIECFHHRLAPIQVTWYGQPSSPGLTAFDYRIVDSLTDPPGTDHFSVERLLRLDPCGFAFRPVPDAPDVQPPPSQRDDSPTRGSITFGSYSNITKLNDETFVLWARILDAVPRSTLILRHTAFGSAGVRDRLMRRLAAAGLGEQAPSRVSLLGPVANAQAMMPEYHKLDIALDTFPYSGMTTTCEALWMGVPVVSLAMDRSVSRYSLAILTNCGLADLVAHTPDDYVRIAVELASDPARLAALRASSRERFSRIIGDSAAFSRRFESAMRSIWRDWCTAHAA